MHVHGPHVHVGLCPLHLTVLLTPHHRLISVVVYSWVSAHHMSLTVLPVSSIHQTMQNRRKRLRQTSRAFRSSSFTVSVHQWHSEQEFPNSLIYPEEQSPQLHNLWGGSKKKKKKPNLRVLGECFHPRTIAPQNLVWGNIAIIFYNYLALFVSWNKNNLDRFGVKREENY